MTETPAQTIKCPTSDMPAAESRMRAEEIEPQMIIP